MQPGLAVECVSPLKFVKIMNIVNTCLGARLANLKWTLASRPSLAVENSYVHSSERFEQIKYKFYVGFPGKEDLIFRAMIAISQTIITVREDNYCKTHFRTRNAKFWVSSVHIQVRDSGPFRPLDSRDVKHCRQILQ